MPAHSRRFGRKSRNLTLTAAALGAVAVPTAASATALPASAPAQSQAVAAAAPAPESAIAAALAAAAPVAVQAPVAAQAPVQAQAPAKAADVKPTTYRVHAGDTLSGIAQSTLGSAGRYPEIFKLNTGKVQNDGRRLSDPNLILIGWVLDLPGGSAQPAAAQPAAAQPAAAKPAAAKPAAAKAVTTETSRSAERPALPQAPAAQSTGSYGNNLSGWINEAISILNANGYYVSYNAIYQTVMHESAGNPSATNGWDINARLGHPSIGLMQTIAPTFNAFALPGHTNIYNPVDNIIAGVRYAASRYGSLDSVVAARCGGSCWFGY